ncbi:MAG: c-type cytochrome [Chloroflexota bacterium]
MQRRRVPTRNPQQFRSTVVGVAIAAGLLLTMGAPPIAAAPTNQSAQEGQQIFQQTCSACHSIGGGARVGPDLQGVTGRREAAWLKVHIQTPSVHHAQNDPVSVANREKHGLPMPDLGLSEQQVASVIASLGAGSTASAEAPPLYLPTLATALLALVALTFVGLKAGSKQVEVRS